MHNSHPFLPVNHKFTSSQGKIYSLEEITRNRIKHPGVVPAIVRISSNERVVTIITYCAGSIGALIEDFRNFQGTDPAQKKLEALEVGIEIENAYYPQTIDIRSTFFEDMVGEFESTILDLVMDSVGHNQCLAAKILQVSRSTLQYRLNKLDDWSPQNPQEELRYVFLASTRSLKDQREFFEERILRDAYTRCNHNQCKTAKYLNLPRTVLQTKLRKYGVSSSKSKKA